MTTMIRCSIKGYSTCAAYDRSVKTSSISTIVALAYLKGILKNSKDENKNTERRHRKLGLIKKNICMNFGRPQTK